MGGAITRQQEYKYQYKTISLQRATSCGYGGTVNFNLPANTLEIKNLWAHVRIQFNASEPSGNQKILGIGPKTFSSNLLNQPLMKQLNLTADGNRRIDFTADLTEIINNIIVEDAAFFQQGYFDIGILHPLLSFNATIELWKMDLVYTTQGIR